MGWWFRRRRRRYYYNYGFRMPGIAIAFGAGLFLALFGSIKIALLIAAIAIVYCIFCRPW